MRSARHLAALITGGWLLLAAAGSIQAQPEAASLRQRVAAAVARDLHLAGGSNEGHLTLLAFPSLPSQTGLQVRAVRAGYEPRTWLLQMDCSPRRDCLPFHVLLRLPVTGPLPENAILGAAQAAGKQIAQKKPGLPLLARRGDHVRLVEERSGLRLATRAVCLDAGALGDEIRVQNLTTRKTLRARVAGKDEVRVE